MNYLWEVRVELPIVQSTPDARVEFIHVMDKVLSNILWFLLYVVRTTYSKSAGPLSIRNNPPSLKGTSFSQPLLYSDKNSMRWKEATRKSFVIHNLCSRLLRPVSTYSWDVYSTMLSCLVLYCSMTEWQLMWKLTS